MNNMTEKIGCVQHDCAECKARLAQPERPWVGLTDEELFTAAWKAGFDIHEDYDEADEVEHWWDGNGEQSDEVLFKLRDLMETKLKEKNT